MKYVITIIFGLLIGHSISLVHNSLSSPDVTRNYGAGPYIEKVQIVGCHREYPMTEECVKSVVKRRYCDLDKLARAVAIHETANCTVGTGRSANNCHGMLYRDKEGKRRPIQYATKNDSYVAFRSLWVRKYGGCPDMAKATKYSGNDRAEEWLNTVNEYIKNGQ